MKFFHIQIVLFCLLLGGCSNPLPTGVGKSVASASGINDALLVELNDGATLVVVASIDSEVQFFDIVDPDPTPQLLGSIFFEPNAQGISPNPWSASATDDGNYLAVSLYDDDAIALVDLKKRLLLMTKKAEQSDTKHPTSLITLGSQVLALFTNFEEWTFTPAVPAKYGPAKIARFHIEDNELHFVDALELPCLNPNAITTFQNQPIVACAGSLKSDANGNLLLDSGAAFVKLQTLNPSDTNSPLAVDLVIPLNDFSPSKLLATDDGFFLTSGITKQILFIPSAATEQSQAQTIALDPEAPDIPGYFPSIVKWQNNIAFIADFRNDELVAFDLNSRSFFPGLFAKPLALQSFDDPHFFKGPQALVARGSYIYALFSLSNEILPVNLNEVATP